MNNNDDDPISSDADRTAPPIILHVRFMRFDGTIAEPTWARGDVPFRGKGAKRGETVNQLIEKRKDYESRESFECRIQRK
jgi:hypothetical protein